MWVEWSMRSGSYNLINLFKRLLCLVAKGTLYKVLPDILNSLRRWVYKVVGIEAIVTQVVCNYLLCREVVNIVVLLCKLRNSKTQRCFA